MVNMARMNKKTRTSAKSHGIALVGNDSEVFTPSKRFVRRVKSYFPSRRVFAREIVSGTL